jgi:hypothetical protein
LRSSTWRGAQVGIAAVAILVGACGSGDPGDPAYTVGVLDSAGVQIVRNPGEGRWGSESPWRFEEDLRIGGLEAPAEEQFGNVSSTGGVAVGPDGEILVLDAHSREIRAFSAQGVYQGAFGGPGQGPGEFGSAVGTVLTGVDGAIVVPDIENQSVHRFDATGSYLDSPRMRVAGPEFGAFLPLRWGRLGSGPLVAQVRSIRSVDVGESFSIAEFDLLLALDESGVPSDTVLSMKTGGTISGPEEGREIPLITLFAPEPVWATRPPDQIVTSRTDAYRLTVFDESGQLKRIIERNVRPIVIDEYEKASIIQALGRRLSSLNPAAGQFIDLQEFLVIADTYPLLVGVLSGPEGTIWVRRSKDPQAAIATFEGLEINLQLLGGDVLDVFDADGAFLGSMDMPDRFHPILWDGDALLGIHRDELDVQSVVRLRLVRG